MEYTRRHTEVIDNADLIVLARDLYIPNWHREGTVVLDPTVGSHGGMWKKWQPELLVTPQKLDYTHGGYAARVKAMDTSHLGDLSPYVHPGHLYFHLIVFDPPYVAKGGNATVETLRDHDARYGRDGTNPGQDSERKTKLTVNEVRHGMFRGMVNMASLLRPGGMLWIKSADYVTSGKVQWGNHDVRTWGRRLNLMHVDELYLKSVSPQPSVNRDGTPRRQVHARNDFSMLSIWRSH